MSIAEQLARAKADLEAVYAAGKAAGGGGGVDYFQWVTKVEGLFIRAAFPENLTNVTLTIPNCLTSLTEMIRQTTGLTKLTLDIPTDQSYKATYFAYRNTDIEEIAFPEGIKLTSLTNFVSQASALVKISGAMDLSESTDNATGFTSCPALVNVEFVPGSITKSISFNASANLSNTSIDSIIAGLANLTGQTTQTLTVPASIVSKFRECGLTENYQKTINWTLGS